jgi:hypothetical protein
VRIGTRIEKLSVRARLIAIATLWLGLGFGTVVAHKNFANQYYQLETTRLQTIASSAAHTGAQLLPSNPSGATRAAHAYAEMSGIPTRDIVTIAVGNDQRSLTVELTYKIPLGYALFEWKLGQSLTVKARADLPSAVPEELNAV